MVTRHRSAYAAEWYNEQPIALLGCIFKQEKSSITACSSLVLYMMLSVTKMVGEQQVAQVDSGPD